MEAAEIVSLIRDCLETATHLAKSVHEDEQQRAGWEARMRQCEELLEAIPGTPEHTAMRERAARLSLDI